MPTNTNFNSTLATDPLRGFRFTATFTAAGADPTFNTKITTGFTGGFSSISGLSINTQAIQYREGGMNTTVHQIPGMTTFNPISFSRGVILGNDQAMVWMRGLFSAGTGAGLPAGYNPVTNPNPGTTASGATGNFRTDIIINVNQHPNTSTTVDYPQMAFKVHNAWITGLNYTDLDATNGAILFETMQLVHEGISVFFTGTTGSPSDGKNTSDY